MSKKDDIESYIPLAIGGVVIGAAALNYFSNNKSFATTSSSSSSSPSSSGGSQREGGGGHHSSHHSSKGKSHNNSHPAHHSTSPHHHTTTHPTTVSTHHHHHGEPMINFIDRHNAAVLGDTQISLIDGSIHHPAHHTPAATHIHHNAPIHHTPTSDIGQGRLITPENANLQGHPDVPFHSVNTFGNGTKGGGSIRLTNNHPQFQTHEHEGGQQGHLHRSRGHHHVQGGGTADHNQQGIRSGEQSVHHHGGAGHHHNMQQQPTQQQNVHNIENGDQHPTDRTPHPSNGHGQRGNGAKGQNGKFQQHSDGGRAKNGKPRPDEHPPSDTNVTPKVTRLFPTTGKSIGGDQFGVDKENNHGQTSIRYVGYTPYTNLEATAYTKMGTNPRSRHAFTMIETGGPNQTNTKGHHNCCNYSIGIKGDGSVFAKEEGDHSMTRRGDDGPIPLGKWSSFRTKPLKGGETVGIKSVILRGLKGDSGDENNTRLIGYVDRDNNDHWTKFIDLMNPRGISQNTGKRFPVITRTSMTGDKAQEIRTRTEDMGNNVVSYPNYTEVHEINMDQIDGNGNVKSNDHSNSSFAHSYFSPTTGPGDDGFFDDNPMMQQMINGSMDFNKLFSSGSSGGNKSFFTPLTVRTRDHGRIETYPAGWYTVPGPHHHCKPNEPAPPGKKCCCINHAHCPFGTCGSGSGGGTFPSSGGSAGGSVHISGGSHHHSSGHGGHTHQNHKHSGKTGPASPATTTQPKGEDQTVNLITAGLIIGIPLLVLLTLL